MQCYRELRGLTARPSPRMKLRPRTGFTACARRMNPPTPPGGAEVAKAEMGAGQLPDPLRRHRYVFLRIGKRHCHIPDPGEDARTEARRLLAEIGPEALHAKLDPESAAKLKPGDSQRIARAYEVLLGTGKGISFWQAQPTEKLEGWRLKMLLLDPPRPALREAIDIRFSAMLEAGALEEARALLALNLPPDLPLLRAHGMPELAAHLRGEITLEDAKARAVLATFQYTKRQMTWFRHQALVSKTDMQIIHSRIGSTRNFRKDFLLNLEFINFTS